MDPVGLGIPDTGRSNASAIDPSAAPRFTLAVIERRALVGECLVRCLQSVPGFDVVSCATADRWTEIADETPASLVVLCADGGPKAAETQRQLSQLLRSATPVVLVTDDDDLGTVLDCLAMGVRGYIPTSVTLEVAVEALRLVRAGGIFVPASSVLGSKAPPDRPAVAEPARGDMFTARQAAVVEALRRGKANKIIAYELNMRESTVKVHVRNIMKKLNAKNRTEVAFITNGGALRLSTTTPDTVSGRQK